MAASRHLGPLLDVVGGFHPFAGGEERLSREDRDRCRHFDPAAAARVAAGFVVDETLLPSSRNLQLVAGDGWLVPACALQNALRSFHIGPNGPFPKVFFRAQSREFLRYGNIDQLIQSNTLGLRNTLCLFEQRRLQSKSGVRAESGTGKEGTGPVRQSHVGRRPARSHLSAAGDRSLNSLTPPLRPGLCSTLGVLDADQATGQNGFGIFAGETGHAI